MRCHLARWLWGLIPVAMLSWIAVNVEARRIEQDLEQRSAEALDAAGMGWASVVFSGRDGMLVGRAAKSEQERALALVDAVWGVRDVRVRPPTDVATLPLVDGERDAAAEPAVRALPDLAPVKLAQAVDVVDLDIAVMPAPERPNIELGASPAPTIARALIPSTQPAMAPALEKKPEKAATAPLAATPPVARQVDVPVPQKKPALPRVSATKPTTMPTAAPQAAIPVPEKKVATPVAVAAAPKSPAPVPHSTAIPAPERKPVASMAAASSAKADEPPATQIATGTLPESHIAPAAGCVATVQEAGRDAELHFARGRVRLDARDKALLDRLIAAANACPQASIEIAGHADAAGKAAQNLDLSRRRASSVAAYLVDKGIDAGRVQAVGYGETRPVAPNDSRANRAKNRRIEVVTSERDAAVQVRSSAGQGAEHGLSDR